MFSLPRVTAPASRRRAAAVHSTGAVKYSRVFVPHEVGRPARWQRSLYASGTPCSGPRLRPAASSASRARAVARAPLASSVMSACRRPSRRAMRSRQACVASTGEILRAAISRARVWIVQSVTALVRARLALEGLDEAGWLLGDRQVGGDSLDGGREACDVGAHTVFLPTHHRYPRCLRIIAPAVKRGAGMGPVADCRSSPGRRGDAGTRAGSRGALAVAL